jgi:hypothetical protein
MNINNKNQYDDGRLYLVSLMIGVFAIKVIIFLIDPTVMFFIADSSRYIDTAVSSYIPPDRSFLYGFLIKWLTYSSQSLTSLVLFQVMCSTASCVIAGYVLYRFLSVNRAVATVFSLLCAIAPLQLIYERYVLTETVSLLLFALFVVIAFCHIQLPKIRTLFFLSLAGVILIAFRLSYLPVVIIGAVIVPGLAFFDAHGGRDGSYTEGAGIRGAGIRKRIITTCLYILLSCFFTFGLHYAYKAINGRLSDKPSAYQYCAGFHLISSWAPLLEKEDYSDPAIGGYTDNYIHFSLRDRFQRMKHRWSYYGLTSYLFRSYGSRIKADKAARDTALNILHRNPLGIIKLAFRSYMDYWNTALLKENLQADRSAREYPAALTEILKSHYHLYGEGLGFQKTLTNQYFFNAIPWFMVLFSLPFVIAAAFLMDKGQHLIFLALLACFALLILINSTALIHRNTMRFFHPDEWIALVFLGVIFDRILKRRFLPTVWERFRIKQIGRDVSSTSSDCSEIK